MSQIRDIDNVLEEQGLTRTDLEELLADRPLRCAFATGSFLEGRAGPTSDLDLRGICCPRAAHADPERSFYRDDTVWCGVTRLTWVKGVPVHVILWPEDVADLIRGKIDEATLDSESPLPVFTLQQAELLDELRVSVPIVGGDYYERFRAGIDFEKFDTIQFQHWLSHYDQMCGETEGPLLTGDIALAAVRSARAVAAAYDCYLFAHGKPVAKDKWRLRHLLQVHERDDPVVERFMQYTLGGIDIDDEIAARGQIEERLAWCNELVLRSQVEQ